MPDSSSARLIFSLIFSLMIGILATESGATQKRTIK